MFPYVVLMIYPRFKRSSNLIFLSGQRGPDLPKSFLSQSLGVVLGEEEVVGTDLAGDGDALQLGLLDHLDLLLPGHVADMNGPVV